MASNKTLIPEAKAALDKFKMEAASEVGVNLSQGYNGDLTARQAGSIGGQMVRNDPKFPALPTGDAKRGAVAKATAPL